MLCPSCKKNLKSEIFYNVEADYCPQCLGIFFEENELRWAKDEKDNNLNWLDIDLWQDIKKFKISSCQKLCPSCRLPLYEVNYGDSQINRAHKNLCASVKVDLCNVCSGIWLERGEFKKIIEYLKERADSEVLNKYIENLAKEGFEIFTGPETFREEISDFLTLLKILNYKLAVQYPSILKIISNLPK